MKKLISKNVKSVFSVALSFSMIVTSLSFAGAVSADEIPAEDYFIEAQNEYAPAEDAETQFFSEDEEPEVYFEDNTEEDIIELPEDSEQDEDEVIVETEEQETPLISDEDTEIPSVEESGEDFYVVSEETFDEPEVVGSDDEETEELVVDEPINVTDDETEELVDEEIEDQETSADETDDTVIDEILVENEEEPALAGEEQKGSEEFVIEDGVLTEYNGPGGDVVIPYGVTGIGEYVFFEKRVASITIPNSVKSIGSGAFYSCGRLTNVTIPNSVKSIGDSAFSFCKNMSSITIPNSVTSIGKAAFYACDSLTSFTFPKRLTSIKSAVLQSCYSLTDVTIPDSVTSIGERAFGYCDHLLDLTIPSSVTYIHDDAFKEHKAYFKIHCTADAKYVISYAKRHDIYYRIAITRIILSQTSATIRRARSLVLTAAIIPEEATNKNLFWESSNTKVATVTSASGKVIGVSKGTAIITATAKDGTDVKATCKVTVTEPVTGVTLNKTAATIKKGNTLQLKATVKPTNASNKKVTWKSNYPGRAKVDQNGLVTAVAPGRAAITATTKDGSFAAKCVVTVTGIPVTGVSLNKTTVTLKKGKALQLTATVKPSNASNKKVTWKSNYPSRAKVNSNGLVTAVSPGRAAITATTADGSYTAKCIVVVE